MTQDIFILTECTKASTVITFPDLPENFVFSAAVSKAATVEPRIGIQKDIKTSCVFMQDKLIFYPANSCVLLSLDRGLLGVSFTG